MVTYDIRTSTDGYRIEATSSAGKRWLLRKIHHTEKAALKRLHALQAMALADMPERHEPRHEANGPQA